MSPLVSKKGSLFFSRHTNKFGLFVVKTINTFGRSDWTIDDSSDPVNEIRIANGGLITLTDKRIIRYFMTIPEASQLVLHSAAIAKNGELMVLIWVNRYKSMNSLNK